LNISEIAKRLGVTAHTLRYYEKIGLIENIGRDESGKRAYSEQDCSWIAFILRLKRIKMPITEITRYAKLRYQGDETIDERSQLLIAQKENLLKQIAELNESVKFIDDKIRIYQQTKDARQAETKKSWQNCI
jgi:DNA-binding transcriptional MerR regulator